MTPEQARVKRGSVFQMVKVSKKGKGLMHRYVDEFAFRLNDGSVERHTLQRLASFVQGVAGKRLTYKALIA